MLHKILAVAMRLRAAASVPWGWPTADGQDADGGYISRSEKIEQLCQITDLLRCCDWVWV